MFEPVVDAINDNAAVIQYVRDPFPENESDKRSELGRGTFGVTYRMRNSVDNELYAVKMINISAAEKNGVTKDSLRVEVKILFKLYHPNIVRYFNCYYNRKETVFNVVNELLSGGSLADKIKATTLDMSDIVKWWTQIASALCYMHFDIKVQHRDIKPDNIMISDNNIKIIDFGLSSFTKDSDASGVGTMTYHSCEKMMGKPYDGRDDVWAVGCVMAELLLKCRLSHDILMKIKFENENDVRVKLINDCVSVDSHYGVVIGRMLESKQVNRCTSKELVELLTAKVAETNSTSNASRSLVSLTLIEVLNLMINLGIIVSKQTIEENQIDGEVLSMIEDVSELSELIPNAPRIKLKQFMSKITTFNAEGVPCALLVNKTTINVIAPEIRVESTAVKLFNILKATTSDKFVKQHLSSHNYQPNSRAWLHAEVDEWLAATPSSIEKDLKNKVFWLQAGAGMGKTVFAAALVDRMNREQDSIGESESGSRLLGAVFIKFNDEKASNPVNVLKSLIYQIALRYSATIDFVLQKLESVKNESESVMLYFDDVLIPLLNEIVEKHNSNCNDNNNSNLLIVIDALDEAGVEGSELRRRFLELFSVKYLRKLPLRVKLFVTGRPEVDVKDTLSYSHVIDENDARHVIDLKSYIRFSLEQVFVDRDDVVDAAAAILLCKCENKFLYTAVVAEQISEWYSEDVDGATLFSVNDFMLKLNGLPEGIDGSYRQTFVKLRKAVRSDKWREFLMCMVSSVEPLSECELKYLLNMESESSHQEFSRLVDHVVTVFPLRESSLEGGVSVKKFYPFHKSIVDWLVNSKKSGEFYCDAKQSNVLMCHKLLSKLQIIDDRAIGAVDDNRIKVNVNLLELMNKNENIEKYLFKHLLTHLDKCDVALNYQYVSHYLLTNLPWIQSCLNLFGLQWLIKEYGVHLNSSFSINCLSDIILIHNFMLLLVNTYENDNHFDWCDQICTQIVARLSDCVGDSKRIGELVSDAKDYIEKHGGWLIESDNLSKPIGGIDMNISWPYGELKDIRVISSELVVFCGDESFGIWNIKTGECVRKGNAANEKVLNLIVVGNYVFYSGYEVHKNNLKTGENEANYSLCTEYSDRMKSLVFSNGITGWCGCDEYGYSNTIIILDNDLELVTEFPCPTRYTSPCVLSDSFIAVIVDKKSIKIWELVIELDSDCEISSMRLSDSAESDINAGYRDDGDRKDNCELNLECEVYSMNLHADSDAESENDDELNLEHEVYSIKLSGDKLICLCDNNKILIVNVNLETMTFGSITELKSSLQFNRYSPLTILSDNSFVCGSDRTVAIFNNGVEKIYELEHRIVKIRLLPDGRLLCLYGTGFIVWDYNNHRNRKPQELYHSILCLHSNDKLVIYSRKNISDRDGILAVWSSDMKTIESELKVKNYIQYAFSLNNGRLAFIEGITLKFWSMARNKVECFDIDFNFPRMWHFDNFLVVSNRHSDYCYFDLKSMYMDELLSISYQLVDDDSIQINNYREIRSFFSCNEIVYNEEGKCYLYSISSRESQLIFNGRVWAGFRLNENKILLVLYEWKGYVIINSNTLVEEPNATIDWNNFPQSRLFYLPNIVVCDSMVDNVIRLPNSNLYIFQTSDYKLIFARRVGSTIL